MGILNTIKNKTKKTAAKKSAVSATTKEKDHAEATPVTKGTPTERTAALSHILMKPLVSEKSIELESRGTYVFVVRRDATKIEIKKAVKARYNVTPAQVRVIQMAGKQVRFGQGYGRRSDWKKALVTLPKGEKISIHEGV